MRATFSFALPRVGNNSNRFSLEACLAIVKALCRVARRAWRAQGAIFGR
jgi:hypothetical protein